MRYLKFLKWGFIIGLLVVGVVVCCIAIVIGTITTLLDGLTHIWMPATGFVLGTIGVSTLAYFIEKLLGRGQ